MTLKKIWNPLYIGIISYFCLVFPAVILWGINFQKLGRPELAKPTFIIGFTLFALLVSGWVLLPDSWDWILEAFHIGISIGGAAFQYRYYRDVVENDDEEYHIESLMKPALLSIIFVLLIISMVICWGWIQQREIEKQLQVARDLYDTGNYPGSVSILKEIIQEDQMERTAYVNLSITYETMGRPDSARIILEDWLKQMPEDSEIKERVYQMRYQKEGN
jgi:tetratricopeptide (TPR) repeat protein